MKKLIVLTVMALSMIGLGVTASTAGAVYGDPGGGTCFEQYCWTASTGWYICGYDCH